jgi:hypothetical protein
LKSDAPVFAKVGAVSTATALVTDAGEEDAVGAGVDVWDGATEQVQFAYSNVLRVKVIDSPFR